MHPCNLRILTVIDWEDWSGIITLIVMFVTCSRPSSRIESWSAGIPSCIVYWPFYRNGSKSRTYPSMAVFLKAQGNVRSLVNSKTTVSTIVSKFKRPVHSTRPLAAESVNKVGASICYSQQWFTLIVVYWFAAYWYAGQQSGHSLGFHSWKLCRNQEDTC